MPKKQKRPFSPTTPSGTDRPKQRPKGSKKEPVSRAAAAREVVESIVIAFILAFLFRTFEAEAFVIPTGSMAPTLMGRHKDVECEKCGYPYQTSASAEIDSHTNRRNSTSVVKSTCPICRYTMNVGPSNPQGKSYPSYKGDRILVGKFPYEFRDPERWEVTVFKYPRGAKTNYIKRIVGLPNETLRVSRGNLHVRKKGEEDFTVARKPSTQLLAMLQPVDDSDYAMTDLIKLGWPSRWSDPKSEDPGAWKTDDYRSFTTDGSQPEPARLEYRHIVPTAKDWTDLARNELPWNGQTKKPQLINDFAAYNTDYRMNSETSFHNASYGLNWVSDLALEFDADLADTSGTLLLELIRGGCPFQCAIDPATGTATLSIPGDDTFGSPSAKTSIDKAGSYELRFSNVDDELRLWVNGKAIEFDAPTTYDAISLECFLPTDEDLTPVRIISQGLPLSASHVKISRDIYYLAKSRETGYKDSDFASSGTYAAYPYGLNPRDDTRGDEKVASFLSDPNLWPTAFSAMDQVEFTMEDGQFFAMGDNSPQSQDSRLWGTPHYVKRELLIGKALLIYWPHGWEIPGIGMHWIPHIGRMRFVE